MFPSLTPAALGHQTISSTDTTSIAEISESNWLYKARNYPSFTEVNREKKKEQILKIQITEYSQEGSNFFLYLGKKDRENLCGFIALIPSQSTSKQDVF